MVTTSALMTAEELFDLPDDGMRHELIAGVLTTMPPTGDEHGGIGAVFAGSLWVYLQANPLGVVRVGETGFLLARNPDTVRAVDVAFISHERLAKEGNKVPGYRVGAPDLVVEIISPSDRYTEVEGKIATWFAFGARMVIVANPRHSTVAVYRSPTQVRLLTVADIVDGEDVLPGWRLPVATIFE